MPRKQTPAQARKAAVDSDYTPLYAVAGLTDALAEVLRSALADTQERGRKRIDEIQGRAPELSRQAKGSADELRTFVITLPDQMRNLPESTRLRIAELQKQANELLVQANTAYGELAGRGKRVVDVAVGSARDLSGKAEKRAEGVLADVAERVDPAFEKVQEGVTVARKTVTGRSATESLTPRTAAKATASRAAKKAPAKKAPATSPGEEGCRGDSAGEEGQPRRLRPRRSPKSAEPRDSPFAVERWHPGVESAFGALVSRLSTANRGPLRQAQARFDRLRSVIEARLKGVSRRSWPGTGSGTARFRTGSPCGSGRRRE